MTPPPPGSALVVAVPEAEPVVGPHRARLDENAAAGVPAHVTVLFPFVPPERLDDAVLDRVAGTVGAVPAFGCTFDGTDWFGDDVLWLSPADPAPFRDLTARVCAEFPEHPPFGGVFPDVVPHLTVGHGRPREVLAAAERAVTPLLPVHSRVSEVLLLTRDGDRWAPLATFPLAVSPR